MIILLMITIVLGLTIFSFVKIIQKQQFRYLFIMLICPIAEFIIILNDYSNFKFPVLNNLKSLLFTITISFLPFIISIIYLFIKKEATVFKMLYGFFLLIVTGYFCMCLLLFSTFSGMFFYSYTTDVNNYLVFDEKITTLLPYDISYFPEDIKDKNVIEYKYLFKTIIDAIYDVELKIKYTDEDYKKEFDKIQNNEEFKQLSDRGLVFIKKEENYCSDDCFLNYIGFDEENKTILYAMTHREGNTQGIPDYFK